MRTIAASLLLSLSFAVACKGDKTKAEAKKGEPTTTDSPPASEPTTPEAKAGGDDKPALPSIGSDPSPFKICLRLAAVAEAEGGDGEAQWKKLARDCEKNLAERMSSSAEKYTAFAECMRDKTTFTAVMNDCRQLE